MSEERLFKKIFLPNEKVQVPVGEKKQERKEGDTWEENGKTWTIRDGIKMSISKLTKERKEIQVPLACPKCKRPMTKTKDPEMYRMFNMCLDCRIEEDNKLIISGDYEAYKNEYMNKNKVAWLGDIQSMVDDYLDKYDSEYLINEFGDIEPLLKGMTKEELKDLFSKQIDEFKEELKKVQKKQKNE